MAGTSRLPAPTGSVRPNGVVVLGGGGVVALDRTGKSWAAEGELLLLVRLGLVLPNIRNLIQTTYLVNVQEQTEG